MRPIVWKNPLATCPVFITVAIFPPETGQNPT